MLQQCGYGPACQVVHEDAHRSLFAHPCPAEELGRICKFAAVPAHLEQFTHKQQKPPLSQLPRSQEWSHNITGISLIIKHPDPNFIGDQADLVVSPTNATLNLPNGVLHALGDRPEMHTLKQCVVASIGQRQLLFGDFVITPAMVLIPNRAIVHWNVQPTRASEILTEDLVHEKMTLIVKHARENSFNTVAILCDGIFREDATDYWLPFVRALAGVLQSQYGQPRITSCILLASSATLKNQLIHSSSRLFNLRYDPPAQQSPVRPNAVAPKVQNELGQGEIRVSVTNYNILEPTYLSESRYPYCSARDRDWSFRRKLIVRQILECISDIVCLQEASQASLSSLLGANPQSLCSVYDQAWLGRPQNVDGCAVLWKRARFRKHSSRGLVHNKHVSLVVVLEHIKSHVRFTVISTHVNGDPNQVALANQQVQDLLDECSVQLYSSEFVIISGDFNHGRTTTPYQLMMSGASASIQVRDAAVEAGVIDKPTMKTNSMEKEIDFIFFASKPSCFMKTISCHIPNIHSALPNHEQGSDHVSVTARFTFQTAETVKHAEPRAHGPRQTPAAEHSRRDMPRQASAPHQTSIHPELLRRNSSNSDSSSSSQYVKKFPRDQGSAPLRQASSPESERYIKQFPRDTGSNSSLSQAHKDLPQYQPVPQQLINEASAPPVDDHFQDSFSQSGSVTSGVGQPQLNAECSQQFSNDPVTSQSSLAGTVSQQPSYQTQQAYLANAVDQVAQQHLPQHQQQQFNSAGHPSASHQHLPQQQLPYGDPSASHQHLPQQQHPYGDPSASHQHLPQHQQQQFNPAGQQLYGDPSASQQHLPQQHHPYGDPSASQQHLQQQQFSPANAMSQQPYGSQAISHQNLLQQQQQQFPPVSAEGQQSVQVHQGQSIHQNPAPTNYSQQSLPNVMGPSQDPHQNPHSHESQPGNDVQILFPVFDGKPSSQAMECEAGQGNYQ